MPRDMEMLPRSQVQEGKRLTIRWTSMSGGSGEVTGEVTRARRGGVADPNGLQQFTIRVNDNVSWRVYVDAGDFEGGRTNPAVERIDHGTDPTRIVNRGTLTGIYPA